MVAKLVVDNVFATPVWQKPLALGADCVLLIMAALMFLIGVYPQPFMEIVNLAGIAVFP